MTELIIISLIIGAGFFFQKKYLPKTEKQISTAYALWVLSIFGILGFHRHYLGKYGTGCLWMFTVGGFCVGALVDLITLSNQVKKHNNDLKSNLYHVNQDQYTSKKLQAIHQPQTLVEHNHNVPTQTKSNSMELSNENIQTQSKFNINNITESDDNFTLKQEKDSKVLEDDSIIDVTNQVYKIKTETDIFKTNYEVPYWKHQYVYSYAELEHATPDQKKFYAVFKSNFISGVYLDLEGNNNYAFILLFDLLNEFDLHKNIAILKSDLEKIGLHYTKTKSYANSFLVNKLNETGHKDEALKLQEQNFEYYYNRSIDYDTFDWRDKYKKSLNLSADDVTLLNKIWYPNNNFINIEFCCNEVIKLYITTISLLKEKFKTEGTTLEEELINIADIIARKHYRYRTGSQNYKYSIDPSVTELYNTIFKYCENCVRDVYAHKRKLNTVLKYSHDEVTAVIEDKIVSKLDTILPTLSANITQPDNATELELNTQNTTRWKSVFAEITANFTGTAEEFFEEMVVLGNANQNNPSVENIFFEASKFIAKQNKEAALKLYVYYLYHDLKSATFDNKQLTKTVQKNLFDTNEQLQSFEQIISELINDKNLDKALNSVTNVYAIKRKKIQLDRTTIKEVQQLHSGTVELLNEYLRDDFEDDNNTIKAEEISTEEIQLEITSKTKETEQSIYLTDLLFNATHIAVLELFTKNSLSILQSEMEAFAKENAIFKNQIIDHINEMCYETLDDVLIEEDDDYYTILPEYFNQIRNNDK